MMLKIQGGSFFEVAVTGLQNSVENGLELRLSTASKVGFGERIALTPTILTAARAGKSRNPGGFKFLHFSNPLYIAKFAPAPLHRASFRI